MAYNLTNKTNEDIIETINSPDLVSTSIITSSPYKPF